MTTRSEAASIIWVAMKVALAVVAAFMFIGIGLPLVIRAGIWHVPPSDDVFAVVAVVGAVAAYVTAVGLGALYWLACAAHRLAALPTRGAQGRPVAAEGA
jgi:hypothetical protein